MRGRHDRWGLWGRVVGRVMVLGVEKCERRWTWSVEGAGFGRLRLTWWL